LKIIFKSAIFWLVVSSLAILLSVVFLGDYLFKALEPLATRLLIGFGQFFIVVTAILIYALFLKEGTQKLLAKWQEYRKTEKERNKLFKEKAALVKRRFIDAIKTIKNSSAYKLKRGAHYELPWYLIMGAESAGKTTLLESSGLDFPLNIDYAKRTIKEEGPTQSFYWYFAEHAVFIDVPGVYISQSEDSVESDVWRYFLKLFRKQRRRRPVNGIILTVSAETLSGKDEKELESFVKDLRNRFDEIGATFKTTTPIYLLIAKSDKIAGFHEYFVGESDKDEALGVIFKDQDNIDSAAVGPEFETLISRMGSSIIERIHKEWEVPSRSKIFLFCNELATLFERLKLFVDVGFAKTRYRKPLMLRGIYFTCVPSAEAQHAIYDEGALPISTGERGWFIRKLLTDIIFPESDIVKMDDGYRKRFRIKQAVSGVFLTLFALFTIGYWAQDYRSNEKITEEIVNELKRYQSGSYKTDIDRLNKLYSIYMRDDPQYIWEVAFFKTKERQKALETLYYSTLEKVLLPRVAKLLENQIQENIKNIKNNNIPSNVLLNNTKAYIMLKEVERRDNQFLAERVGDIWEKEGIPQNTLTDLKANWRRAVEHGFSSYEIKQNSLNSARSKLLKLGHEFLVYEELKNVMSNDPRAKDFRFSSVLSSYINDFENVNYTIPGFFTKNGYERIMLVSGKGAIKSILKDDWVLEESVSKSDEELNQLYDKVQNLYFNDYEKYWLEALNKINLPNVTDAASISRQLAIFTSADSPVFAILKAVKTNTQIYTLLESAQRQLKEKGGIVGAKVAADETVGGAQEASLKKLRGTFAKIGELLDDQDQQTAALTAAIANIKKCYDELLAIQNSSEPSKEAFNKALGIINKNETPVVTHSSPLPPQIDKWFKGALQHDWNYIVSQAKVYVDSQYKEQVHSYYIERLHNKFPFNRNSPRDAEISDVEEFFKKGGVLDRFVVEYVTPFAKLDYKSGRYQPKAKDGAKLDFSNRFLDSLVAANEIGKRFFNKERVVLETTLDFRPIMSGLSQNLSGLVINYDGGVIQYENGPIKNVKIIFPPQSDNYNASFDLLDLDRKLLFKGSENSKYSAEGEWALFRALGRLKASKERAENGKYVIDLSYETKPYYAKFSIIGPAADFFSKKDSFMGYKPDGDI
jgi:type VI secretion system protein ImpL